MHNNDNKVHKSSIAANNFVDLIKDPLKMWSMDTMDWWYHNAFTGYYHGNGCNKDLSGDNNDVSTVQLLIIILKANAIIK